jgi:preprotein translocase subunit SecF
MNKILTGIVSALLVAGIFGMYIPNVSATIELCSGNSALAQEGSSSAEQSPMQEQESSSDAQSVAPEFNALTGNSLNLDAQQNGDCYSTQSPLNSGINAFAGQ